MYVPRFLLAPSLQIGQISLCKYQYLILLFCLSSSKMWQHYYLNPPYNTSENCEPYTHLLPCDELRCLVPIIPS